MVREELGALAAFAVVAEERSFTRAAKRLEVSPSALSHAMRRLEEQIGVRLLSRTTRSVAPTEAGEQLLESLRPALGDIHGALDRLSGLRARPAGRLRLLVPRLAAAARRAGTAAVSLTSERADRIDPGRAARRPVASGQANRHGRGHGPPEDRGVEQRDTEQEPAQHVAGARGEAQADRAAADDKSRALPQHHAQHVTALGSESDSDAELARPSRHGECGHAVDPDGGEQETYERQRARARARNGCSPPRGLLIPAEREALAVRVGAIGLRVSALASPWR